MLLKLSERRIRKKPVYFGVMAIGVDEVLPVLTDLLSHSLASTRAGALNAISEMGSAARTSRPEVERLTLDESESVRGAAVAALKSMSGEAEVE